MTDCSTQYILNTIDHMQWNLSIMDTLGTEKRSVIQRFPLFRGYFMHITIHLNPQKQFVVERFLLLEEFDILLVFL